MASPKPAAAGAGTKGAAAGLTAAGIANLNTRIKKELDSQWNYGREWGSLVPGAPSSILEERDLRRREALELTTSNLALTAGTSGGAREHPMFTTTAKDLLRDGERPSIEAGLDKKTRARLIEHAYGLAPPGASPLPPALGSTLATLKAASPPRAR